MSAVARILTFERLRDESPTVALLRSPHWPLLVGTVAELFVEGVRRVPSAEFYESLGDVLGRVRDAGLDVPLTAQGYAGNWVDAGWLVRRPGTAATGETLEPAQPTLAALEFIEGVRSPRRGLTASRVETLAGQLESLARETDPSLEGRLESLQAEKARIEAEIEKVEAGEVTVATPSQAHERVEEILHGAADIPADFARVRAEFDALNQDLRRRLLDQEGSRGEVLESVFGGVDLIGDSDAGRSFASFYGVLLDPERSAHVDSWIEAILDRSQLDGLPPDARRELRRVFSDMESAGADVSDVLTSLSRSLRHFVTSDAYVEHRRMLALVRSAKSAAMDAMEQHAVKLTSHLETLLRRVGTSVRSVGALRLRNPGDERVTTEVVHNDTGEADLTALTALVRASEIDEEELRSNVAEVVARLGPATIGTVLREHPATQGVASLVGLINLAVSQGAQSGEPEVVGWHAEGGLRREARIPALEFSPAMLESGVS